MFGSCLNRNDYLHKPKMFDNVDNWLDRLKTITDYDIEKWRSYDETKQDKFTVDDTLTFINNVLSVNGNYISSIFAPMVQDLSYDYQNAVGNLRLELYNRFITPEDAQVKLDELVGNKFDDYDTSTEARYYVRNYVSGTTYTKSEVQDLLAQKQPKTIFGKGIKVDNNLEASVIINNDFSVTRYLDLDRFVHIGESADSALVDGWNDTKEIDWQREYHENKETQAFTVKNMLRVDYDEDTKTYTLGVPYTNRLVDADYAITSRTILRELRSEYEKKIFVLGDSIQLADIDWFVQKFRGAYEEYINLPTDAIRTAYFRENPDYPNLKTDFDTWYECEFGPTAVDRITDLVSDKYQRAITIAPNGMLDKNADGSDLGENYWRGEHTPYLYTTDGEGHYYTPDQYSFPTTFEVKKKVVELHDRIDSLDAEITSEDGTNVQVKVTEVDGKITAVNITTDNTINSTDLTNAINALDVTEVGGTNKYISAISEADGKISATVGNIDTTVTSDSSNLITSGAVAAAIDALPEPMVFKGSVGSGGTVEWANLPSPSSSNKGWTYKVITDNNTAPICKVGDTIISDSTTWVVIPSGDEPSGTVTNVAIQGETNYIEVNGSPITSSGTISISLNTAQKAAWNNKISGVQLNGTDLTADANKKVNVIVPQVYRFV